MQLQRQPPCNEFDGRKLNESREERQRRHGKGKEFFPGLRRIIGQETTELQTRHVQQLTKLNRRLQSSRAKAKEQAAKTEAAKSEADVAFAELAFARAQMEEEIDNFVEVEDNYSV